MPRPRPSSATSPDAARALVDRHEAGLDPSLRRDRGAHYTPPALARMLVQRGLDVLGRAPRSVCDPSCGAGALLLAAADALHESGLDPVEIVNRRLHGAEIDPSAVVAARDALRSWAVDRGAHAAEVRPDVVTLDALTAEDLARQFGVDGFDLVVGNPPFLDQLDRRSARDPRQRGALQARFGALGPYCDTAALFLLASLDLLAPDGVLSVLQPQSFLAARDTAEVRAELLRRGELVSLWGSDEHLFEAQVRVCAPVVRRNGPSTRPRAGESVEVIWGLQRPERHRVRLPPPAQGWGPLLAPAAGLPAVPALHGAPLRAVASGTAGFRDEYYALCDAAVEGEPERVAARPRLITVGMVDPWTSHWGRREFRLGGTRWRAPELDLEQLNASTPRVGRWVSARRTPKVMVATQTRIIEATVDPAGSDVPVTPLISIEPLEGDRAVSVWHLAAALSAPPVAAEAVARRLGSGLSAGSVRWSATSLLDLPLPVDHAAWARAARTFEHLQASATPPESQIEAFGRQMCDAHELEDPSDVLAWWLTEVRRRATQGSPRPDPA